MKPSHPWTFALALFALMMVRVMHFHGSPDAVLIGIIPDDAFYYLQMAAHRAHDGQWTFDGTAPATGFHVLYGYGLVAMYKLMGHVDWRDAYLLVSTVAAACIASAAWMVWTAVNRWWGPGSAWVSVAPFFATASLTQSTAMMESWLVILFAALMLLQLSREEPCGTAGHVLLAATGLMGSLARSDFGMLPGCLFLAAGLGWKWTDRPTFRKLLSALVGAVLGVAVVLAHNEHISGHLSQASADIKLHWSAMAGHSIVSPLILLVSVSLPFAPDLVALLKAMSQAGTPVWMRLGGGLGLLVALLALVWISRRFIVRQSKPEAGQADAQRTVWLGAMLCCVAYVAFYRHNSAALQSWYAANLLVPVGLSFAGVYHQLARDPKRHLAMGFCLLFAVFGVAHLYKVTWPHQAGMLQGALYLKAMPHDQVYGGWNAGIVSYFSQQTHVNLDGLTNDDAVPFIKSNTLMDYIKARQIRYIADYSEMLTSKGMRARGGYVDPRVDRCLIAERVLDEGLPRWANAKFTLYKVKPGCLSP